MHIHTHTRDPVNTDPVKHKGTDSALSLSPGPAQPGYCIVRLAVHVFGVTMELVTLRVCMLCVCVCVCVCVCHRSLTSVRVCWHVYSRVRSLHGVMQPSQQLTRYVSSHIVLIVSVMPQT